MKGVEYSVLCLDSIFSAVRSLNSRPGRPVSFYDNSPEAAAEIADRGDSDGGESQKQTVDQNY